MCTISKKSGLQIDKEGRRKAMTDRQIDALKATITGTV